MKSLVFFNNKGDVGKTTLVYHLAHMFSRLGVKTLAVDLDPQANLTSGFFDADAIEQIWIENKSGVLSALEPMLEGTGDLAGFSLCPIDENLWLVPGHLGLSRFEDMLSQAWPGGFQDDRPSLRKTSAFHRIILTAGKAVGAALVLIDVGPNLGAINRAAVLSADYLVVPLAADLFSLQGMKNLGPTVDKWRADWGKVLTLSNVPFDLPKGSVEPAGYVVLQAAMRLDRPALHYGKWMARIPDVYQDSIAHRPAGSLQSDELALIPNYRSLMPMAQDARKPMFDLKAADGALGSHATLVRKCFGAFELLARKVGARCGIEGLS